LPLEPLKYLIEFGQGLAIRGLTRVFQDVFLN
jgi:hypothetical protein